MNALQLLKERELRAQLRHNSKKQSLADLNPVITPPHLSPVKLTKDKTLSSQLKYRGVSYEAMRANWL